MKVRVLGCSGAIARDCRTTSFLVDQDVLIDAGTGVGELTRDDMLRIEHVFLTHSHLDHVAGLPLMVDTMACDRIGRPVHVHALPQTIAALRAHVFNGVIWPDFSCLPSPDMPLVRFHPLEVGELRELSGRVIEALPARHSVPAVGYAVRRQVLHQPQVVGQLLAAEALEQRQHPLAAGRGCVVVGVLDAGTNRLQQGERPEPEPLAQRIGIVEADFGVDGHARAVTS